MRRFVLAALGVCLLALPFMAMAQFDTNTAGGDTRGTKITALPNGISITGVGTCSGADAVVYDNNGVAGCQKLTDVAPQGVLFRPQPAFAAGAQSAAKAVIAGGQDETKCAIDGADPSVSCAGDNDSITVTVIDSNGAIVATTLTEGTAWTASASVATTCASLASAVDALAGVGATCTSPNVLITLDLTTAAVALAESTAGCTTVATGTQAEVQIYAMNARVASPSSDVGLTVENGTAGQLIIADTDAAGPFMAAHVDLSGNSTDNFAAVKLDFGANGLIVSTSPATTVSNPRTWTTRLTVNTTTVTTPSTITSSGTGSIGWSVVVAANTACNTTCTNACVVGFATGAVGTDTERPVDCTDATADRCLCAGAN